MFVLIFIVHSNRIKPRISGYLYNQAIRKWFCHAEKNSHDERVPTE